MLCLPAVVASDIIRAEGADQLSRTLMDLGLSLQVLWEPAAPRLDQRLLCLRLVPVAHREESRIPASLELGRDFGIGHRVPLRTFAERSPADVLAAEALGPIDPADGGGCGIACGLH